MPLSDNEQRLLEQMERALYAEDPKFASTMRGAARRPGAVRRLLLGGAGIVVGLVVLVLGVAQKQVLLGVLGFVCMLAGTAYAVSGQRRGGPLGVVGASGSRPPRGAGRGDVPVLRSCSVSRSAGTVAQRRALRPAAAPADSGQPSAVADRPARRLIRSRRLPAADRAPCLGEPSRAPRSDPARP